MFARSASVWLGCAATGLIAVSATGYLMGRDPAAATTLGLIGAILAFAAPIVRRFQGPQPIKAIEAIEAGVNLAALTAIARRAPLTGRATVATYGQGVQVIDLEPALQAGHHDQMKETTTATVALPMDAETSRAAVAALTSAAIEALSVPDALSTPTVRITRAFDCYVTVLFAMRLGNPYGGSPIITPLEGNTQIGFEAGVFQQIYDQVSTGRWFASDENANTFAEAVINGLHTIHRSVRE